MTLTFISPKILPPEAPDFSQKNLHPDYSQNNRLSTHRTPQ